MFAIGMAADAIATGLAIGFKSDHSGDGDYNEDNLGLCLESGFERFGVACAYRDSFNDPAGALGIGGRLNLVGQLHLGGTLGLKFKKEINKAGRETINPDPLGGMLLTYGGDSASGSLLVIPGLKDSPEVRYLLLRLGF